MSFIVCTSSLDLEVPDCVHYLAAIDLAQVHRLVRPLTSFLLARQRLPLPPALSLCKPERDSPGLVLGSDVVKGLASTSCFLADLPRPEPPDDMRCEYPKLKKTAVGVCVSRLATLSSWRRVLELTRGCRVHRPIYRTCFVPL